MIIVKMINRIRLNQTFFIWMLCKNHDGKIILI